ncbi:hypothetical protein SODALDRAFT_376940 [Sodiomyces alkalinus F11]|uniref:RAD52 homolog n=1 Tax=Sodiomyces alkalinus (strain CBS 110278 / VKM F-3762 / F11) TaxID=1314773 RepID=A0A3N2Q3B5_SODAK|nr:hypothetical protein SODALDRAFT_376940 [Sodiomyces alkalinus F11]ROT41242.1 hypothetical protein SODALDRAFT_376940 [Sodiomyces alkalinus F11]
MPAPGDQHLNNVGNPFEEPQKRVSEYTAQEIATLQSRLERQLGPEYISARSGPSGQKVHYIAAEKCIALANEVFGFNGWSSSIQNIQVDFVDEHPQTMKISLGLSVIVRVTLRDGTFHEDIGYGHIENCKGKAAAFEKAKKEGTTDALKRALRNFGNVLGNCIYDKDYLAKVVKLKAGPTKFDESRLHRHSGYAKKDEPARKEAEPVKKEKTDGEKDALVRKEMADSLDELLDAEFDEADFAIAEEEHPDEVALSNADSNASDVSHQRSNAAPNMQPPARPMRQSGPAANVSANPRLPQTPNQPNNPRARPAPAQGPNNNRIQGWPSNAPQPLSRAATNTPPPRTSTNTTGEPIAFFSARAVQHVPLDLQPGDQSDPNVPLLLPAGQQAFNPKAESPSIRKTPGIDHSSSKPVARNGQHVPPSSSQRAPGVQSLAAGGGTTGFNPVRPQGAGPAPANPQLHQTRRIGVPGGPPSPLANRGSYRPPTMVGKRPAPAPAPAAMTEPRQPLAEVTNKNGTAVAAVGAGGAAGTNGVDGAAAVETAKRQRTS